MGGSQAPGGYSDVLLPHRGDWLQVAPTFPLAATMQQLAQYDQIPRRLLAPQRQLVPPGPPHDVPPYLHR